MRKGIRCSLALLLLFAASPVLAQVVTIKSPPLATSDTTFIPVFGHQSAANPPWAGWAGGIVKMHLLDATELDVLDFFSAIGPMTPLAAPGGTLTASGFAYLSPFGPPSSNLTSLPASFNLSAGAPSGLNVSTSSTFFLGDVAIHVKNSTIANNSDIDLTFMLWNIWHLRTGTTFASQIITLDPSDRIWVPSSINDPSQLHTASSLLALPPGGSLANPNSHWLHLNQPWLIHLTGSFGSGFYATGAGTLNLGIEHVPEPTTGALIGTGFLLLGASRYLRRRRLAA